MIVALAVAAASWVVGWSVTRLMDRRIPQRWYRALATTATVRAVRRTVEPLLRRGRASAGALVVGWLMVLTAVGIRHLCTELDRRAAVAVVLVFVLVFPSAMVLSSDGAVDSPVFENQPDGNDIRPDQVLFTDHPYQTLFTRTGSYPADTATVNESEPVAHEMVVYREEQTRAATYFLDGRGVGVIRNVPQQRLCRPDQAVLYSNADVKMCVDSPATAD